MKIIDQTPFYKENGELGLIDRARAMVQFGPGWIKEVEAQKVILGALEKALDRRFTLLRNVTPPGLGTMIPLILAGPTGMYVIGLNYQPGMFSARGDQWGVISGGSLKPENPNLLVRTERMARAIQVYLQRQGYTDLNGVEAILLCSDPATNVDSVRPIIRVVMRDALERFAVSIAEARVVFSPESVADIVNRLLTPPPPPQPQPVEPIQSGMETGNALFPESSLPPAELAASPAAGVLPIPADLPAGGSQVQPVVRRRKAMSGKQWAFLIAMFIIWAVLAIILIFLIVRDQSLLSLTP